MEIAAEWREKLLALARQAATAAAARTPLPAVNAAGWPPELQEPLGAFVTLHHRGRLRGCIGRMSSDRPLPETIADMAAAAAMEDPRFPPLRPEEVSGLEIEISVLSPLSRVQRPEQIRLGQDGVLVRRGRRTGVFLPQVAVETGWDLPTFLSELCSGKAGLAEDAWQDPETELYVFTALVFSEGGAKSR
ncbi:MAG: AmmeMemoRadiSam system protein A [candidate division FCPU426 bacterium]